MWIWIVAGALSLIGLGHLWTRKGVSALQKLLWTLINLVPVLGPLLYGGLFEVPPDQRNAALRAPNEDPAGGDVGTMTSGGTDFDHLT